ncbi:hypothetical protein O181_026738 [Austropuccinia psidii MF-1]|uniref:Uncharacterized protein n=1 Tax=Austropuccinia psidii MF-1 TaxID=1389203 RepID=A0A9Q3CN55_9BASI|nr:hypothetical protein [Austropuccinia psidii MF-1]
MVTTRHHPPDETPTLSPHLPLTTPYTFTPPPLPSLRSCGALLACLQRGLPSLCASSAANHPYACVMPSGHASKTANYPYTCVVPSQHASNTANHPYACVVPSQHASNTVNHPYACVVPSQHASDTDNHPYTCVVPSQHASKTAYHPYTCRLPSQHASDAALTLASSSRPLMILTLLPGPQDETTMLPPISTFTTPYASSLPRRPQDMPPTPPSTLLMPPHPCHLPSSCFPITSIVYGGLLAYTMNAIKEIC